MSNKQTSTITGKQLTRVLPQAKRPVATPNKSESQLTRLEVARQENEGGPPIREIKTA